MFSQPRFDADLTSRARIRDAAITRFADQGIAETTLKEIADDVGVSPPLVLHHFGSKDGLRAACDSHVAAHIRETKRHAVAHAGTDPLATLRNAETNLPLVRYLARTLADGSPHVADLIDEIVADAVDYMAKAVESGALRPTDHPRERAVVLTIWQLGALALHSHVKRLLGADLTGSGGELLGWIIPSAELLSRGAIPESVYEQLVAGADAIRATTNTT